MISYFNFIDYLQNELDKKYPNKYEVTKELNVALDINKTTVVVKAITGSYYDASAQIPYLIEVFTDNPSEEMDIFTEYGKEHNNKSLITFGEVQPNEFREYHIVQNYNTPMVMETDVTLGHEKYAKITMTATMFIMYGITDVTEFTINGEIQEVLEGSITYATEQHSNRVNSKVLNSQYVKAATTSIQISILNRDTIFSNQIALIRQGKLSSNTIFNCVAKKTNGTQEEYSMILSSAALNVARGKIPTLVVSLVNSQER